ncbi:MAG: DNA polymerase III subunit chi [Pelovirga sp.]
MTRPRVYFVLLERQEKALHIARLIEQSFLCSQRILVRVANDEQAYSLDHYLWSWKKDSFLPHGVVVSDAHSGEDPIVITTTEINPIKADVLICGSPCSLAFIDTFELVYDFAETYNELLADQSRERFRQYRLRGLDPQMESNAVAAEN